MLNLVHAGLSQVRVLSLLEHLFVDSRQILFSLADESLLFLRRLFGLNLLLQLGVFLRSGFDLLDLLQRRVRVCDFSVTEYGALDPLEESIRGLPGLLVRLCLSLLCGRLILSLGLLVLCLPALSLLVLCRLILRLLLG
jgi:hypothetical protein